MTHTQNEPKFDFDVLVVGAGIAGIYLLYRLRKSNFKVCVFEAGSNIGGTWYWNCYPGARCDVDSFYYSYQFDEKLEQDWDWTERYASQPEILSYLNYVVKRFNLRDGIKLNTKITAARYDEEQGAWEVEDETGKSTKATYCVMATGCLSAPNIPNIDGLGSFLGDIYHTSKWPHDLVNFSELRVGVIGTGSTAVQVIPEIAKQASQLTVFQRTANYVLPANNRPLTEAEIRKTKQSYSTLRRDAKKTFGGFNTQQNESLATESTPEEREIEYEKRWQSGGIGFLSAFSDLTTDENANKTAQGFVRKKICEIVTDPKIAEL
ncbi:uncharacterized protein METZ01_LOCUS266536, partial [marine metagenome]